MDMDTFFSETNIASLRHLAVPGITATDRTALFQVLSKRFLSAQNLAEHRELAFARRQSKSDKCSSNLAEDEGKRRMEDLAQLHAQLDRTQAEIENGIRHLIKQRARAARGLGENDVTQSRELLAALEDTQLLHVQHRDRLRRKLDWTLAGNKAPSWAIPPARA
jgi:hypothetical protein